MDTNALIQKAKDAQPEWAKRRPGPVGRWAELHPVFAELIENGFTIREAVDWMIREGAVPEKDRTKAFYGLSMVTSRRKREAAIKAGTYVKRKISWKANRKPRRA